MPILRKMSAAPNPKSSMTVIRMALSSVDKSAAWDQRQQQQQHVTYIQHEETKGGERNQHAQETGCEPEATIGILLVTSGEDKRQCLLLQMEMQMNKEIRNTNKERIYLTALQYCIQIYHPKRESYYWITGVVKGHGLLCERTFTSPPSASICFPSYK